MAVEKPQDRYSNRVRKVARDMVCFVLVDHGSLEIYTLSFLLAFRIYEWTNCKQNRVIQSLVEVTGNQLQIHLIFRVKLKRVVIH